MAAGPTDTFSAAHRGFGCYERELIASAADNLWSSRVVATVSTGASWVDDVHSDTTEKRIEEIKRKFHHGRLLLIKHVPREVTEEEIRELLNDWDVQSVNLQSGSARVMLINPEILEDWNRNAVFSLRGQRVSITPSPTEMLLCVGRLPITYTEQQFIELVSAYGDIKKCFLMISDRTGDSKGYGFVEYVTKEAALQAKNALDGRQIMNCTAVCDWLDSSHVTVKSLHSKCLYVDHLPPNYRDMGEFRRIFSTVVNPPYCQIALKNGCPQDWGLVEFTDEYDAEKTQQILDGYLLHGHKIRIVYYIPGVRAINLYLKLLNEGGNNKSRSALLPDPPAPAVFQQLQSLSKQNPVFAQNLHSIIMQEIQDVQKSEGVIPDGNGRQGFTGKNPFATGNPSSQQSPNSVKNAQQTALTLLLASQMQQNGNVNCQEQQSPTPSVATNSTIQNQSLVAAIQAISRATASTGVNNISNMTNSEQFLNGVSAGLNHSSRLNTLLTLANPSNAPTGNEGAPPGFFSGSSSNLLMTDRGSMSTCSNDSSSGKDDWSSFKVTRNLHNFSNNGFQKVPLLPDPNELNTAPTIDIPMETGMSRPKSPPRENLHAVWYSLFGQSGSFPDSQSTASGSTSPMFIKSPLASSSGSPVGHSGNDIFSRSNSFEKCSPPGFNFNNNRQVPSGNNGGNGGFNRRLHGDLQEALSSLLNSPQNLSNMLSNNDGNGAGSHPPNGFNSGVTSNGNCGQYSGGNMWQQNVVNLSRQNGAFEQNGISSALLDLLMQTAKSDQTLAEAFGGMKTNNNCWNGSMVNNTSPSPIGNHRNYCMTPRNGMNDTNELGNSSPKSPHAGYSPFSRTSGKGMMEAGNGSVSPTPQFPWNTTIMNNPSHSSGGFGGQHLDNNFHARNIWSNTPTSLSPNSIHSPNNLMNPLGQKRKVHHENGLDMDNFAHDSLNNSSQHYSGGRGTSSVPGQGQCNGVSQSTLLSNGITLPCHGLGSASATPNPISQHYATDTFQKKKKKT